LGTERDRVRFERNLAEEGTSKPRKKPQNRGINLGKEGILKTEE